MGHIKEPEGVEFTVLPQTKSDIKADRMFSEFIRKLKLKNPGERAKIEAKAIEIIRKYKASQNQIVIPKLSGCIKEPKGIDITVIPQTKPDEEADRMVSDWIQSYKTKNSDSN